MGCRRYYDGICQGGDCVNCKHDPENAEREIYRARKYRGGVLILLIGAVIVILFLILE